MQDGGTDGAGFIGERARLDLGCPRREDIPPLRLEVPESPRLYGSAHLPEEVEIEIEIMICVQPHREDFP